MDGFLGDPGPATGRRPQSRPGGEPDGFAAELPGTIRQRIFAAGLILQDAAAISADPLVRRRIDRARAELDEALRVLVDLAFGLERHRYGHARPGASAPSVGGWLAEGEAALDVAAAVMTRAGELDGDWREHSPDSACALRGKLDMLRTLMNDR